jgi:orotidine-5'-phosphate decarboxylase
VTLTGKDRLIVALDVPTHAEAFSLVDRLDNVSFFKVGLELFMAGDVLGFLKELQERRANEGGVFVDLKLAGDIPETVASLIRACMTLNVKFLTLVESVPLAITLATVRAARAARGAARDPQLLMVPLLSSLDATDLKAGGENQDVNAYIVERGRAMISHGCDGLIVSGDAIRACRQAFGAAVTLVSPGIRPAWATLDEKYHHKRFTTPAQAIRLGADYLVVGRPITRNSDPKRAAQRVIDEIDGAFRETEPSNTSGLLSRAG